jgi:hypothetical protein
LRPVGDLEFGEDIRDVIANCLRADHKLSSNFGITITRRYQVKYFSLAARQFGERFPWYTGLFRMRGIGRG